MANEDFYLYLITALLPISAMLLMVQGNPYHALVLRGILGAIAALVYCVFGAADVGLTEALVGTFLAITLYAVAVRSSLVLRLGVLSAAEPQQDPTREPPDAHVEGLVQQLRQIFRSYHMRVELVNYASMDDLKQALQDQDVHAICTPEPSFSVDLGTPSPAAAYQTITRLQQIYDILQGKLSGYPVHLLEAQARPVQEKH